MIKQGNKFLYKYGWFGTSFGGLGALLFGKKYETILTVVKNTKGELWFMDEMGCWFDRVGKDDIKKLNLKKLYARPKN